MTETKNKFVGLSIKGTNAHMTITFLGKPDLAKLETIVKDLEFIRTGIENSSQQLHLEFTEWAVLGKPIDIAAGKGLRVRKCLISDPTIESLFVDFHQKHYFHAPGEAEERKLRPQFHVTVGKISESDLSKLFKVDFSAKDLFLK